MKTTENAGSNKKEKVESLRKSQKKRLSLTGKSIRIKNLTNTIVKASIAVDPNQKKVFKSHFNAAINVKQPSLKVALNAYKKFIRERAPEEATIEDGEIKTFNIDGKAAYVTIGIIEGEKLSIKWENALIERNTDLEIGDKFIRRKPIPSTL